jgi:hypothetical protein
MTLPTKPNLSNSVAGRQLVIWPTTPGADTDLDDGTGGGLVARQIVVGNAAGALVLKNLAGQTVTMNQALIYAQNCVLDGQWTQIVASGSAAYNLLVKW